jgi:DNA-binding phage protein
MGNIMTGKAKNIAETKLANVFQRLDDPKTNLTQQQKKEKLISMYDDFQTLLKQSKKLKQAKKNLLKNPPQYIPEYPINTETASLGKITQVFNLFSKMKASWQTTGNVDPMDVQNTINYLRSILEENEKISNNPKQSQQNIKSARKMTQQAHVAIEQLGQFMKSLKSNGSPTQIQQVLVSQQQVLQPIKQKTQFQQQTIQQS